MSYGLRYQCDFLNINDDLCRIEFYQKDYQGVVTALTGGAEPFVLSKDAERITEPVQATKATIQVSSDADTYFDLDSFYSEDDEEWLIKFYQIPFGGIQRTIFYQGTETSTSFNHTTTDNRITLGNQTSSHGIKIGQQIEIEGNTYDITAVDYSSVTQNLLLFVQQTVVTHTVIMPLNFTIYDIVDDGLQFIGFLIQEDNGEPYVDFDHYIQLTASDNLGLLSDVTFDTAYTGTTPIFGKFTLAAYLQYCLIATGMTLPIEAYCNIRENSASATDSFLNTTLVYSGRFANDDGTWLPCFDVITELLEDAGCVLCQERGKWIIFRPDEFRHANGTLPGTLLGGGAISRSLTARDTGQKFPNVVVGAENNQSQNVRPYKYTREEFKYEQPAKLIQNLDLQQLGSQIAQTTTTRDGETITLTDYTAPYWFNSPIAAFPNHNSNFIRVETDSKGIELSRYLVAKTTDNFQVDVSVVSSGVWVNKGDKITISVSAQVPNDNGKNYYRYFVRLYDGTVRRYLSQGNTAWQDGSWQPTFQPVNSSYNPNGSDYREWHSWGSESLQIPADGWLNIEIGIQNVDGGTTNWKDFQLTYEPFINQSTLIAGQSHQQTQPGVIKNNNTLTRFLDDSPRNLIAGTLLTDALTTFSPNNANFYFPNPASDYVTRTSEWHRFANTEALRLGQITTLELKQQYSILRHGLDCTILFDKPPTFLTSWRLPASPTANYLFGRIAAISYRNCTIEGTLLELWRDGEPDVAADYEFKYDYEKG